jgi:integrase
MATVRKRTWVSDGEVKTAWIADYFDQNGKRHIKTFTRQRDARDWLDQTTGEVKQGVHTPERASITVAEAGELWIENAELNEREKSTLRQYRNHVDLHITPRIGALKLARLTSPTVVGFRDDLLRSCSRPMARKVLASLKGIIKNAQAAGLVAQNVTTPVKVDANKRDKRKLKVGREIPSKREIQALLATASGRWRPFFITATFTGMRASELRGLPWDHVDFERKVIHVCQRANLWGDIGPPKTEAGDREIPMSPMVVNALREWRLACPRLKLADGAEGGRLWLAFPNGNGNVESHANIENRGFYPLQLAAGITKPHREKKDENGNPIMKPKYGLHALRHFFASWAIEQEFSPKRLQALLGHTSVKMTYDVYGHLFPSPEDDHAKFAAGELALVANHSKV